MYRFRITGGPHGVPDDGGKGHKLHNTGDIIESEERLDQKFHGKFQLVEGVKVVRRTREVITEDLDEEDRAVEAAPEREDEEVREQPKVFKKKKKKRRHED